MSGDELESRRALRELIALLQEIDDRYLGDEWLSPGFGDTVDGFRSLGNLIEGSFFLNFESDPERPFFRPIVSRSRKMLGDNPDAIYYTAPVRSDRSYRVTGNLAGAVYLSFTVEVGSEDGGYSTMTAGTLRDRDFDVAPDGSFEVFFGGEPRDSNWLELADRASELIVRCYFEEAEPAAADVNRIVPLTIEMLEPVGPVAGLGRRRGGGGLPASGALPAHAHAGAAEAGGAGAAVVGVGRRRTSSRRRRCRATSRSPRPTRRTRWRRTCSGRTRRWS